MIQSGGGAATRLATETPPWVAHALGQPFISATDVLRRWGGASLVLSGSATISRYPPSLTTLDTEGPWRARSSPLRDPLSNRRRPPPSTRRSPSPPCLLSRSTSSSPSVDPVPSTCLAPSV